MPSVLTSKVEDAYQVFEKRILNGSWPVGEVVPTENELAAELGCSRPTISKAISRLEHEGFVMRRKRTGTRVLRNTRATKKVEVELDAYAFIFPSKKHEGLRRMVQGFQDVACEIGRRSMTLATGSDYRKEVDILERLPDYDVRGCVMSPAILTFQDRVHFSQVLISRKMPFVIAGLSFPGSGVPSVEMDGFHAGFTLTQHLLERGARKIGFFASNMLAPVARDKYLGYRRAMEDAGLPVEPVPSCIEAVEHPNYEDPTAEPTEMATSYLKAHTGLEGVVCLYDFLAVGLMKAAHNMGMRIPQDIKVAGIDGFELTAVNGVSLTTYCVPYEKIGAEATRILDQIVKGETPTNQETQLQGKIIVREST